MDWKRQSKALKMWTSEEVVVSYMTVFLIYPYPIAI